MHDVDRSLLAEIEELLPERIFDVHVHVWQRAHLGAGVAGFGHWLTRDQYLSEDLTAEFALLFPGRTCSALLFPLPVADGDVAAMNRYLANLVGGTATPGAVTRGAEAPGVELPDTKMPDAATPGGARPDVQMPDTPGGARPDVQMPAPLRPAGHGPTSKCPTPLRPAPIHPAPIRAERHGRTRNRPAR